MLNTNAQDISELTVTKSSHRTNPPTSTLLSTWSRVKLLFATAFADACSCSSKLRRISFSERSSEVDEATAPSLRASDCNGLLACANLPVINPKLPDDIPSFNWVSAKVVHCVSSSTESLANLSAEYEEAGRFICQEEFPTLHSVLKAFNHPLTSLNGSIPSVHETVLEYVDDSCLKTNHISSFSDDTTVDGFYKEGVVSTVDFSDDYQRLVPSPEPFATILTLLYTELELGILSPEEHAELLQSVIASVIPRNLSDCLETQYPTGARKMYAWQDPQSVSLDNEQEFNPCAQPSQVELTSFKNAQNGSGAPTVTAEADPGKRLRTFATFSSCETQSSTEDSFSNVDEQSELSEPPNFLESEDNAADVTPFEKNALSDMLMSPSDLESDMTTRLILIEPVNLPNIHARLPHSPSPERPLRTQSPSAPNRPSRERCSPNREMLVTQKLQLPTFLSCEGTDNFSTNTESDLDFRKPKRSSSLKSNRTPPDTPTRKIVRFADAFGLDLETVRQFFDQEVPPKIPASAIVDLNLDTKASLGCLGAKQFQLCFSQPGSSPNFLNRVLALTVCLETARIDSSRGVLTGNLRVKSLGFEKQVTIRVTYNDWATFCDTPASYVQGSHDGVTDRFSFSIVFPSTLVCNDRAQFAIRYQAHDGAIYWDNNHGENFIVSCYAKATDLAGDGSWLHYL